jgi:hypothetical protein
MPVYPFLQVLKSWRQEKTCNSSLKMTTLLGFSYVKSTPIAATGLNRATESERR